MPNGELWKPLYNEASARDRCDLLRFLFLKGWGGSYIDSDGYVGTWEMTSSNKLDIITTNSLTNIKTKSSYDIVTLNAAQLQIKITGTKGVYQYFFVISN